MINSIWESIEGKKFKIDSIKIIGENIWVYYQNIQTKEQYHCLLESFQNKFWQNINGKK